MPEKKLTAAAMRAAQLIGNAIGYRPRPATDAFLAGFAATMDVEFAPLVEAAERLLGNWKAGTGDPNDARELDRALIKIKGE